MKVAERKTTTSGVDMCDRFTHEIRSVFDRTMRVMVKLLYPIHLKDGEVDRSGKL